MTAISRGSTGATSPAFNCDDGLDTEEQELAELERRMRRKLLLDGPSSRGDKLSDEERKIAEKLMGRENAERRQNWRGDRPFRPKPVFIHYETYQMPGSLYFSGRKVINKVENGRASEHQWREDNFDTEVARLRKEGFEVRHVMTEREKFEAAQTRRRLQDSARQRVYPRQQGTSSGRKFLLDRLKDFKL